MMVKNYYPRFKNLIGSCIVGLAVCGMLGSTQALAQTPTITHVSSYKGIPGTTVDTIYGTNFNATASNNIVRFGATKTAVTSASATRLIVTVPFGALNAPISVTDTTLRPRLTAYSDTPFIPEYDNSCFIQGVLNFVTPRVDVSVPGASPTPYIAQLGDLDGDGLTDMVVGKNGATTGISWYHNTSTGPGNISQTFVNSVSAGGPVTNVKMADFDGDGRLDVVVAIQNNIKLGVFRNITTSSTIAFASEQTDTISTSATSPNEYGVVTADFDRDGKPDIAVVLKNKDSISVLRNTISTALPYASGAFPATTSFARYKSFSTGSGSVPSSIFVADFDGDGRPDIVTCNSGTGNISVFRDTSTVPGSIGFDTRVDFNYGPLYCIDIATGDLDGDGKPDIFVSTADAAGNGYISVLKNTSSGSGSISFATHSDIFVSSSNNTVGVTCADIDGDGKLDIVTTIGSTTQVAVLRNTRSSVGSLAFASPVFLNSNSLPTAVTIGDMDNDGKPDIVTACQGGNNISIFRNNPLPYVAMITGPLSVCMGTSDTLTDSTSGGTWTSVGGHTSINATTGVITPLSVGTDTITYTFGCQYDTNFVTRVITVTTTPTVDTIAGTVHTICSGGTITLTDDSTGGTWSSYHTSIATVLGGVVTTVSGGIDTIAYSITNTCGTASSIYPITVHQTPSAITGVTHRCVGAFDTLHNAYTGGSWSVSPGTYDAISSVYGRLLGTSAGIDTVKYTLPGGCFVTTLDTVLPSVPSVGAITGPTTICSGTDSVLHSSPAGGVWTSSSPSIATVDSVSGTVYGLTAGTANITYTVTTACGSNNAHTSFTVVTTPGSITATASTICAGLADTMTCTPGSGTWTSSAGGTAAIGTTTSTSGSSRVIVTGGSTAGTATITYTIGGLCTATHSITVHPAPPGISGSLSICVGGSTTLTDSSAGTWTSSNTAIPIGASTGTIPTSATPGTTTISFTSSTYGCIITRGFTVYALPPAVTGPSSVCAGSSISGVTVGSAAGAGTWSSSATGVATVVGSGTSATVFGATSVATATTADITFTSTATTCSSYMTVTVNPVPGRITGSHTVCAGLTDTLTSSTSGGTWSILSGTSVSLSSTGVVTAGTTPGTSIIKYSLSTSCADTFAVTVNPLPAGITGASSVCPGYADSLRDATTGGSWSSANTAIATVSVSGTGAGGVIGVAAGTDSIYYTLPTGCRAYKVITVNPAPSAMAGLSSICFGDSTTLTDTTAGGIWTSSPGTGIAVIDSFTGVVHGTFGGTATISYTTGTYGCSAFLQFTVIPSVVPSVGISLTTLSTICAGTYTTFTASITNGGTSPTYAWRINNSLTSTGTSLTYAPVNGDSVNITITSNAQCATPVTAHNYVKMTVNPLLVPAVSMASSAGRDTVCLASSITYTATGSNGGTSPTYKWIVNGVTVWTGTSWTYYPANGDVISVVMRSNATCRTVDTAIATRHITVSPYVTPTVSISGSDSACAGYPIVYHTIATNAGTTPLFEWYKNGFASPFATGSTLAYVATNHDYVYVKLTSNFPCVTTTNATSATDTITVIPVTPPVVHVTVSPGYILAAGSTAYFAAFVTNGGSSPTYQWFRDGGIITGATNATYHTHLITSGDSFVCRVTNHDYCNGITSFDYSIITIGDNVGVNQVDPGNAKLNLVPNPNNGSFTIKGDLATNIDEDVDVEITNMLGQVIYKDKIKAVSGVIEQRIQLEGPPANGLYMINVHSEHVSKVIRFALEK